jgi:hypothetical protein
MTCKKTTRKILWIPILCLWAASVALPMAAQDSQPPAARRELPPETRSRLLKLIPTPPPAEAAAQGAVEFYTPETLYQYMDGGADVYVLYELEAMMHQEFHAGQADVTVDIFDMGADENAFGIYASERSPEYEFISMGAEGYRNQGILNFLQGRYYVKLAGFGNGADAALERFAHAISSQIGGSAALPPLLLRLPQNGRKPHSEQYLLKDPLGNAFLAPAYLAKYSIDGKESTLLVSVAPDADEARERMRKLAGHFRSSGECRPAPELGEGAIRAANSFEGNALARAEGHYVVVLFSSAAGAETLFREALQKLQ